MVSGGAPLAPHVEQFMKAVLCVPVVQVSLLGISLALLEFLGWKPVLSLGSYTSPMVVSSKATNFPRPMNATTFNRMPLFAEGRSVQICQPT